MRDLKILMAIAAVAFAAGTLVGCGDKKKGGAVASTPAQVCPADQLMTPHGCLQINGCPAGQAWYPAQNKCVDGTVSIPAGTGTRYYARISLTSNKTLKNMLEDLLLCDYYNIANLGSADCDTWDKIAEIYLSVADPGKLPTKATATIVGYSEIWGMIQTSGVGVFNGNVYAVNGNNGWEFQGLGPANTYAFNRYLNIKADPGKLSNTTNAAKLIYSNTQFGTANLRRF